MATPIPANTAALTAWGAAAATGGRLVRAREPAVTARGITSDSRAVVPGAAFVALRGERFDGNDFIEAAVRSGAALVVAQTGRGGTAGDVDLVEVDDTLAAWADLGRAHLRAWRRDREGARVVAITGSAGKTTTKELCAALLSSRASCHATAGNLNNRIGVPAVAFGLGPDHGAAVFEIGMSERGEIARLAQVVEPDVAVITNVGLAHAQGVGGTRSDVAREKGELFESLAEHAAAVACFDDPAAMGQLARTRARRSATFGVQGGDYRLVDREVGASGQSRVRIRRRRDGSEIVAVLSIPGEAAALDLCAALAAAELANGPMQQAEIDGALRRHPFQAPGRMQVRQLTDGKTLLDDTYNSNPHSMRAALRTLSELARGRRAVVVVGEMRELGSQGPAEHTSIGDAIVEAGAALVISCGGLADLALRVAEGAGIRGAAAVDAEAAAQVAVQLVQPGDVVLLKASRGVGAERVVAALVEAGGGEVGPGGGRS
jgi:UDP-N-acetylmuramoyl-tripeptide--D-alanyl-D-alanine ligase